MKKIVAFMGSPRKNGNSAALLDQAAKGARDAGAQVKVYNLNDMKIRPCQACMLCRGRYACSQNDDMTQVYADLKDASAVILASPVYMFGVTAQVKLLLDRLFPVLGPDYKPRTGRKRALFLFTQGNPDGEMFSGRKTDGMSHCFSDLDKLFAFWGMEQSQQPIVAAGANDPSFASKSKEMIAAAYAAGKKLTAEEQ